MIALLMTYPYAKVENEPALILGFREDIAGKVQAIVCTVTDEAVKLVDLNKVKIDTKKLRNIPL